MNMGMFNGMFGKIAPGMCRVSMNGKIAIRTSNGSYKTYDISTGTATNCDNFAFDIGEDFFFVIPTNSVKRGDIILADGKPKMVLEVGKNEIKTFCYEDSTISTIVPERHIFMGSTYFYGKIVSMFGNSFGKNGTKGMMKYMMLSEMMKGNPMTNTGYNNMLPMMFMMNGGMDDLFDFDDIDVDSDVDNADTEEEN